MMEEGKLEPDQTQLSPSSPLSPLVNSDGMDSQKYVIMQRPEVGSIGRRIHLLVNHLKVSNDSPDQTIFQYNVKITSGDRKTIEGKSLRAKIIDRLACLPEFRDKSFVFDRKGSLYTIFHLPQETTEFTVLLEESYGLSIGNPDGPSKMSKHSFKPRQFIVEINYSGEISLHSIAKTLEGPKVCDNYDALRVLNVILRQHAINRGCLLVGQSFFKDDTRNSFEVGGGLTGLHGFHSSFHMTKAGLTLNFDVAVTLILTPGSVLDFLLANQNVKEPRYIDWKKAKRMLTKLRIKTVHSNREYRIMGLSERPCYQQSFTLRLAGDNGFNDQPVDITVSEYFHKHCGVQLTYSKYMPCLDVGKPNKPIYIPIELCSLVPLQRYTKMLSPAQRAAVVEKTKHKPHDRMKALTDAMKNHQYEKEPLLSTCGIHIQKDFMQVAGRVLEAPKLKVGKSEDCIPCNGRWTYKNKHFLQPINIECWAIVNFSSGCDTSYLSRELINCGRSKGMNIERPYALIEENQQMRKSSPLARVDEMFEKLQDKLPGEPEFILCVLPERKSSDLYGPWKMRSLCTFGIITQCVCPVKITEQYLTNVLLKINSKLGGVNSLLAIESPSCVPHVMDIPTMIVGMDVSHSSPGRADFPSIAAVVGSLSWPLISRYRAAVRIQLPRAEMIDSLYKPLEDGDDDGIMRELLVDFYTTSNGKKPKQMIIFRDGVSESQFSQVLNIELEQIRKAYLGLGEKELPKFTVIVAQKNHHTRLFEMGTNSNVPAGTVVDTEIVHPRNYDFYMCAHAGMIGTLRPVHYHVLLDEIGFSPDDLQNFIHSLCYAYQRSTRATSVVAPISYAHHAARQVRQFVNFEEMSETISSKDDSSITTSGSIPVLDLPRLHDNVIDTMFFC